MNGSPVDSTVEVIKKAVAEGAECGYRKAHNAKLKR
jgi:hypothetical protein